jgi:hypothetical protein
VRFFENQRARLDNDLDVVKVHKTHRQQCTVMTGGSSTKRVVDDHTASLYGIVNYLPTRPSGETDQTIGALKKILVDESRRVKKNVARIQSLMDQTFADRRKLIVVENATIEQLRTEFPCLFEENQVHN